MPKPKPIQDTAPDAQKIRRKSGIDKRVSAVETSANDRITNLRYTDFLGVIPSRAYDVASIPGSALTGMGAEKITGTIPTRLYGTLSIPGSTIIGLAAGKLEGTLPTYLFGDLSVPNSALSGVNGGKITGTDVMPGSVIRLDSMHSNRILDGTIGGVKLAPGIIGYRELNNALLGGNLDEYRLRRVQTAQLGGNSEHASASNHSHGAGDTMSFEVMNAEGRRRSLAQRLLVRRRMRDVGPIQDSPTSEDYNKLLGYVHLLASQVQTLSHLLQDAPDRDGFEREKAFRRNEIDETNIFFEYRASAEAVRKNCHIASLPHKWNVEMHPDFAV